MVIAGAVTLCLAPRVLVEYEQWLSDPDDAPFLEVAFAGGAAFVVTGNVTHFPERARCGVAVRTPAEFAAWVRDGRQREGA